MKNLKGFIQIPHLALTAVIISAFIIGGVGYFGVKQYQNYQIEKVEKERLAQEAQQQKNKNPDVEELKKEIEALKNQKPQVITQTITKEIPSSNVKPETSQEKITTPTYIQNQIQNHNQTPGITEIAGHWRFFTAKVEDVDGSGLGSGFIIKSSDGTFKVLTNKHVVEDRGVFNIRLPGNPIDNILQSGAVYRGSEDFATISFGNSNEYLKNLISGDPYKGICPENQKPILGDEILILGYPGVGSQTDITITKGIISGFEGNYFITDAKVNPGNSGGVAIYIKNNCYFGIPTYKIYRENFGVEALARILDIWKVMGQF